MGTRASPIISKIASLISRLSFRTDAFLEKSRIRLTISAARLPSLIIRSIDCPVFSRFGGRRASQRTAVSAFVSRAAIGWLTSWAIEAVSWPIVAIRFACASSASARLRSVRSRTKMTKASPRSSNVAPPVSTGTRLPSFRKYSFSKGWTLPTVLISATARASRICHSGGVSSVRRNRPAATSA